jgi:integrase
LGEWRKKLAAAAVVGLDLRSVLGLPSPTPLQEQRQLGPRLRDWWGESLLGSSRVHRHCEARNHSRSERGIVHAVRLIVNKLLGDVLVKDVTSRHGEDLLIELRDTRGLKPSTVRKYMAWWHRGLDLAVKDRLLPSVPEVEVPIVRLAKVEKAWLDPEGSRKVLEKLKTTTDARSRGYRPALLALQLGVRPGEARTRRWSDIDWDKGTLRIGPATLPDGTIWAPKTASSDRFTKMPAGVVATLKELWLADGRGDGWICPGRRPGWPLVSSRRALATACGVAEVRKVSPHGLRHSAATRWAQKGATGEQLAAAGGWSSVETPNRYYVHPTRERGDDVVVEGEL